MKLIITSIVCLLSLQVLAQQPIKIHGQKFQSEFKGRSMYVKLNEKEYRLGQPTDMFVGKEKEHQVFMYKFDEGQETGKNQPKHCIYLIRNDELTRVFVDKSKLKQNT